jgi:DNA-binding transcriptional MerR regulator
MNLRLHVERSMGLHNDQITTTFQAVLQARLTTSQLAQRAQIPLGSIGFYIACGLLEPSIQGGGGKGHARVFSFRDLVVAMAVSKMRVPNISVEGMQKLAEFWRELKEPDLRSTALANVDAEQATESDERVLVLLDDGRLVEDENLPILQLTRKHGSPVVHVVDPGLLAHRAHVGLTQEHMVGELVQPGPSGRVPRGPKPEKVPSTMGAERPPGRGSERRARGETGKKNKKRETKTR